jgi:hypothetical protein
LPFSEWAALNVAEETWWKAKVQIEELGAGDKALLGKAREIAKRSAAIDTGAIEGLYELGPVHTNASHRR